MTADRLKRIEELYFRMLDLPLDRRAAALEKACDGDGLLRREVESLLKHAQPPAQFLSEPPMGTDLFRTDGQGSGKDELIGRTVGLFRIVERVASGGMGTVYRAVRDDGQFEQQVAIKVVKRGMDSEDILKRFGQERRTLAALNHPNIARLLDGGATGEGRPYLIMDYVPGLPIDRYCDQQRLTTAQRLRIFLGVCEAVRFAHQNLIVHRDLKPGNILVSDTGIPRLVDFGIAKVLSGEGSDDVTVAHERRLTPEYASPEQVAGQSLSTASDIYSLGVILYELLTGHRPYRFETRTTAEIERVVRHAAPPLPSAAVERIETRLLPGGLPAETITPESVSSVRDGTPDRLRRRLRGDLDTIVLKAMHKDPARRYASIEQFAADIERHLAGLPVLAQPDTVGYRLRKFVGRHGLAVTAAAAGIVLAVTGVAIVIAEGRIARRERDAAYLARDQAEATVDFFQGMLSSADPANLGPDARVREVLDTTAAQAVKQLEHQPLLQAAIRSSIGRTYLGLGLFPQAREHVQAAYDTRRALLPPGHHDLAESQFDLSRMLYSEARYREAEELLRECLATHRRLRGDENVDTARVWNDLGAVLRASGKLDDAEAALRRALEIRGKLSGQESLDVAESLNNLAGVLRGRGDLEGAQACLDRALSIRQKLLRPDHPLVIQSMPELAVLVTAAGDMARGEELYRAVVDLDRKVYGESHPDLATDLSGLGQLYVHRSRYLEAEPLLRQAFEIRREKLASGDTRRLRTQALFGICLARLGHDAEAEPLLAEIRHAAQEPSPAAEVPWGDALEELALIYERARNDSEASAVRTLRLRIARE